MKRSNYTDFGGMLVISFVFMYMAMFFNVSRFDHIMLSYTRTYMAVLMVAPMAVIMLLFKLDMYKNKKLNYWIIGISLLLFTGSLTLLRTQKPISDIQYMKAMIPHHSSAIMVSERANLRDPETQQLAKEIIEAQKEEIAKMEKIISRLEKQE